jgi:probable DNA repair protein
MYGWIADACDESSHVVTANRRLARVLKSAYDEIQVSEGKVAWPTASISSLQDWFAALSASGALSHQPTWISPHQSRVLWQRIIRREIPDPLVNEAALTRHARDAWQKLCAWRVPIDELQSSSSGQDQRIFARVATAYRDHLAANSWIDEATAGEYVLRCLEAGELVLPERITLAGFDRLTPITEAILDVIRSRGVRVTNANPEVAAEAYSCCLADPDAELRAAGAWARAGLLAAPDSSIAVVVSDLEQDAERAANLIREGFVPGWQYAGDQAASAVNVSYGQRLSEFPATQVALLLLTWAHYELRTGDISVLLRTPFLGEACAGGRSRLELELRRIPDRPWTPAALLAVLRGRDESPDAIDWLERLRRFSDARAHIRSDASPSVRAQEFDSALAEFGWPGSATLDSRDFQLVNRWRELLNDFSRLSSVHPSMTPVEAFAELKSIVSETIYQPELQESVLQVIGPLEAAGMQFDKLWVTGLTSEQWPPAGRPLALVSRPLQRKYEMPDADPTDTAEYSRRVLNRLAQSATCCIFSYASHDVDRELSPSAFADSLASIDPPTDPGWHAVPLAESASVETLPDDPVPTVQPGEKITGGASTVQRQFDEPFGAFVHGRLGVASLQAIFSGLSPMLRGNLLHEAAFRLYSGLPTAQQLAEWDDTELKARVERASDDALRRYRHAPDAVLDELLRLERDRLVELLTELVSIDLQREPFRIDAVESAIDARLAGIDLRLRVDRIDRYGDGSVAILDYKSGTQRRFIDATGEPLDVQLVVYASAVDGPVAELGLYHLDRRASGIDGAGRASMGEEAWKAWLKDWQARIGRAAEQLAAGDVRIRKWQTAVEARPLNLLSRFGELRRDG